jgi:hypothetical protein
LLWLLIEDNELLPERLPELGVTPGVKLVVGDGPGATLEFEVWGVNSAATAAADDDDDADDGVIIILNTSSRDIKAASIAAQCWSTLLLGPAPAAPAEE